jgi:hypothetical protein
MSQPRSGDILLARCVSAGETGPASWLAAERRHTAGHDRNASSLIGSRHRCHTGNRFPYPDRDRRDNLE